MGKRQTICDSDAAAQFPLHVEQYVCLTEGCQATIRQEFIFKNTRPAHACDQVSRMVQAYCEHCDSVFEAMQTLHSGAWHTVGKVQVITDQKRRAAVLARVAQMRGDLQIA